MPIYKRSMEEVRCGADFPGIEASISILQCKFPPFDAKLVHPSVNLPASRTNLKITVLLNKVVLDNSHEAHIYMTFTNISSQTLDGVAYNSPPTLGGVSTFGNNFTLSTGCLLYTSPSPRD